MELAVWIALDQPSDHHGHDGCWRDADLFPIGFTGDTERWRSGMLSAAA
jgi:hypothetical protein